MLCVPPRRSIVQNINLAEVPALPTSLRQLCVQGASARIWCCCVMAAGARVGRSARWTQEAGSTHPPRRVSDTCRLFCRADTSIPTPSWPSSLCCPFLRWWRCKPYSVRACCRCVMEGLDVRLSSRRPRSTHLARRASNPCLLSTAQKRQQQPYDQGGPRAALLCAVLVSASPERARVFLFCTGQGLFSISLPPSTQFSFPRGSSTHAL
jgi:hypothetical protein